MVVKHSVRIGIDFSGQIADAKHPRTDRSVTGMLSELHLQRNPQASWGRIYWLNFF